MSQFPAPNTAELVARLAMSLERRGLRLATAESCSGGLLAAALTARPGCSAWFEFGFVTYSNRAKQQLLGVSAALIDAQGAVSRACVEAMVSGALRVSGADLAVAISGVAGPDGGSPDKPVGTVWLAWGRRDGGVDSRCLHLAGGRGDVREQAVNQALVALLALIGK